MREQIGIELFRRKIAEGAFTEAVVGSDRNQQRDRISLADINGAPCIVGSHRTAFVQHLDLTFIIAAEQGNRPLERQQISRCRDRAGALLHLEIRNHRPHGQRESTLPVGGEPDDDHIIRIRGKIFAFIGDPVLLIGHVGDGFIQIE